MSPTSSSKRQPQPKPGAKTEQCRDGRSSVPKAAAADADGGSLQPSKSTAGATSSGADDAAAAVAKEEDEMLALIGQELVPVVNSQKGDEKSEEESKKKNDSERFQTPSAAKPPESPEQLQLQNSPHVKQNDDEIQKGESEEKGQMMVTPNGPPTMYGPVSVSPATAHSRASRSNERSKSVDIAFAIDKGICGEW